MSNPYKRALNAAERLLKRYGQFGRLYSVESTGYDPLNPTSNEIGVMAASDAFFVALPVSESALFRFDADEKHDPTVLRAQTQILIAGKGLAFKPQPGMVVRSATMTLRLAGCTELNPNGQSPILYRCLGSQDVSFTLPEDDALPEEIIAEGELV
jgi:hypothetical protein